MLNLILYTFNYAEVCIICARTNEVPLKTKFICRLFTRREPWFQTFQFASTGRDRNKHDAHFLRFCCTLKLKTDRAENLKQISQPFHISKTRKIEDISSRFIPFSTHFFLCLINFVSRKYFWKEIFEKNRNCQNRISKISSHRAFVSLFLDLLIFPTISAEDYPFSCSDI